MEQINVARNVDGLITGLKQETLLKNSNSVASGQLTESEQIFLQRFPSLDKVYKAFGPDSWRYALEHVDKAVNTAVPTLNRLNLIYNTKDADMALFLKHFLGYYLMVERSGKELGKDVCTNVAAIFLGRNGAECTPVKLLCYFANYPEFKDTFREFDPEDIIIQYNKKFKEWWGNQVAKYGYTTMKPQTDDKQPCGLDALKLTVRGWIENGEDLRQHDLYKVFHSITDEMIDEIEKEIALGVF
ncbi:MAG: hypothetical protein IKP48_03565 [Bacteroidaceae bacterium]|nr:hypothetical protein [Bacteroidaceae bacterium]